MGKYNFKGIRRTKRFLGGIKTAAKMGLWQTGADGSN